MGGVTLGTFAFSAILVCYAVHGSMPFNPISLPLEARLQVNVYLPEGWKFFTRDPQEEAARAYQLGPDHRWVRASPGTFATASHVFGLDRTGRTGGVELGHLLQQVPASLAEPCKEDPERCLARASAAKTLHNDSPRPTLCGTIGVVYQKPIPWAWAHASPQVTMPSRVVVMEVRC
jgi:antimicrobial peptide system SdpA family protein